MKKSERIGRKILLLGSVASSLIYIGWRWLFTIPTEYGLLSLILGFSLVIAETVGVIEAFSHYRSLASSNCPEMPVIYDDTLYPEVDVFISTHSESKELLYKTVNGCIHMEYPDKKKIHIYLCDDSNRSEMKALADEMGIGYFGLSENKHAKAGNLNNAIGKTKSSLIVTFDADMIPRREFLMETVPYFFLPMMKKSKNNIWIHRKPEEIDENYKIGFIQTPQSFYNADLFQFNLYSEENIPNEQDFFFKEVNVGRNRVNAPIYAGSNTVISRAALEEVGGITTGNITEDFATGIKIQSKGYRCFAIAKVLANGLAPTDFKSLLNQRQRWGRGCVQTIRSFKFLFGKLPFGAKLSYVTSFLYWWTFFRRFIYIMAPILYTVFGIVSVKCNLLQLLLIWLPYYLLYNLALKKLSGDIRDQKWSNIVDTILFPYMIIPILLETLGIRLKKFVVTPKDSVNAKNTEFKYAIPHIILIIASIIGLIFSFKDILNYKYGGTLILIYWSILNLYFLIMSVAFMLSRVNYRGEYRYNAALLVEININNRIIKGVTADISEGGMAIVLKIPEYIPYDRDIDIRVYNSYYDTVVQGKVLHVDSKNHKWIFGLKITHMEEISKREYYQLVYDRIPTLPTKINSNFFKEIKNNTSKRVKEQEISNRKLPRIDVGIMINKSNRGFVNVINFNYEYILIKDQDKELNDLTLDLGDNLILNCKAYSFNERNNTKLYKIEDWETIACDERLRRKVLEWLNEVEEEPHKDLYSYQVGKDLIKN